MAQLALQKMQKFYELFPYPNRSFFASPQIYPSLMTHMGFSSLLKERDERAQTIWGLLRFTGSSHGLSKEVLLEHLPRLNDLSQNKTIGIVGCGTDEPLLFKKIHPQSFIVAMDLSKRSLRIAKLKLMRHFLTSRLSTVKFVAGDATDILLQNDVKYDHLQCFGVLHHQPVPKQLFAAMAESLKTGGTLRLMVYSDKGRRLERRVQERFKDVWSEASPLKQTAKLVMARWKLFGWQLANKFRPNSSIAKRFRYLGLNSSSVADAFMHPSDPGFDLNSLVQWADEFGFEFLFSEAKVDEKGWIAGFKDPLKSYKEIISYDLEDKLLSNIVLVLEKK